MEIVENERWPKSPPDWLIVHEQDQTKPVQPAAAIPQVGNYRLAKEYVHVHKIHDYRDTPFALMDIFVDARIYRRFPKGADETAKLSFLLRERGNVRIALSRQELTISHATQQAASMLRCTIAAPLVRVRRWRTDAKGVVVYACVVLYRGDLFAWDVTETAPSADHYADHVVPDAHPPQE